ncbi:hypothetical protein [Denitromonas ohlonensis]|uniref:Uncharacterized protein n=2 Tax=Denitromonas TaxID=139331 RepID=A0A557REL4_9RHOO|nr:hypothetical protein [Denitromonas ohlonensis]TVO63610.1 hypothetical protein FHP90_14125 [Denitromonas ohlonensis]TVO74144.1 hypothetical protein FHP89_16105 [Denitromonas ohlonensis]
MAPFHDLFDRLDLELLWISFAAHDVSCPFVSLGLQSIYWGQGNSTCRSTAQSAVRRHWAALPPLDRRRLAGSSGRLVVLQSDFKTGTMDIAQFLTVKVTVKFHQDSQKSHILAGFQPSEMIEWE